jgi:hypothetical protein
MNSVSRTVTSASGCGYIDQSSQLLGLGLYKRFIEPESFTIFSQKTYRSEDVAVQMTVIGASHVVNVQWWNRHLAEMLACSASTVPDAAVSTPAALVAGRDMDYREPSFDYFFRLDFRSLPPETDELPESLMPRSACLASALFPSPPGIPNAMTLIGTTIHPDEVVRDARSRRRRAAIVELQSVHWYQSESAAVCSRSLLHLFKGE